MDGFLPNSSNIWLRGVQRIPILYKAGNTLEADASWDAMWQPLLASVDGAMNRATCLRGCRNTSHWLLVNRSETSPRDSTPHVQYGWNMPRLAETEKHSLV